MAREQLFTTVRSKTGGLVHAVDYHQARTACDRSFRGMIVLASRLTCPDCLHAVFYPTATTAAVAPPSPRRRRRRGS